MQQKPWNQPLPPEIILGGTKRFSDSVLDPVQSWVVSENPATSSLKVHCQTAGSQELLSLLSVYSEIPYTSPIPMNIVQHPILDYMDWDWVEFHYEPLSHIQVEVINWVPDLRVICGLHRVHNTGPLQKEIFLRLSCQGESGKKGFRFSRESHQGRKILADSSTTGKSVLFMTGSTTQKSDPANQLVSSIRLEPGEIRIVKWLLVHSGPGTNAHQFLDEVIQLDWEGEIGRRKVSLSSQLQIKTGNKDQDYSLATSQRLAKLILNRRILQAEYMDPDITLLDPLQVWQLLLAHEPLDPSSLEWLLRSAIQENPDRITPLPIEGQLLRRAHQLGLDPDILRDLLPIMTKNLESWFLPNNDRDGDGIPEEPAGDLFHLERFSPQDGKGSQKKDYQEVLLETPGLAALLQNELSLLGKLKTELLGSHPSPELIKQLHILEEFLLSAWQHGEHRFQSRNYLNHLSKGGYELPKKIHNGWNILDTKLPFSSQLRLRIPEISRTHNANDLSIIIQGTDWQGNYRIEELTTHDILWHDRGGWGTTRSYFAHLEHCVVFGLNKNQEILIKAPGADREDLSHTLPLWIDGLPRSLMNKMITRSLAEEADFWSTSGFKTYPQEGNSPVQLPLNLLVCQGLIKSGHENLAGKVFSNWLITAAQNICGDGWMYSAWDSRTGSGFGKKNRLESLLPIGMLLDLLGLRFLVNGELLIQERNPTLYPILLAYRGAEIKIEKNKTVLSRSSGNQEIYLRGTEVVIPF